MAKRKLLIEDFLYPALESRKYGELLCWLNGDEGIFKVYWGHKNASDWKPNSAAVFQDWDKAKVRWKPEDEHYYACAKQRFRAAMHKLPCVRQLKCLGKNFRIYQLISIGRKGKKLRK
ncbi:hypothetical protein AVEN_226690-1 [Araneus ventricosus]|uniref:IRF tryptophan pentad repeat domain-containing protein n=1 Tax=Araneus ventricosus TaxID=182803 RepID=A0A4Y2CZL7_ARAVE|nr:hypothetical protein AVEN_226690-1 [Araneus ventricosus]